MHHPPHMNPIILAFYAIVTILLIVGGVVMTYMLLKGLFNRSTFNFLFGPDEDEPPPNPPEHYR